MLTENVFAAGVVPPWVYENARLVGLSVIVGVGGGGGRTVIVCCVVPVPPEKPSIAAPQIVATVLVVTVGAVQVNVHE